MNNSLIKGLSILALVVFGFSMAACGSKNDNNSTNSETVIEKEYEYRAEFEPIELVNSDDTYVPDYELKGDVLYAVLVTYFEKDNESFEMDYRLCKFNLSSGERTVYDWSFQITGEQYISSIHVNNDDSITVLVTEYNEQGETIRLATYNLEGEILSETDISKAISALNSSYISQYEFLDDDKLIVIGDASMAIVNKDGSSSKPISVNGWIDSFFADTDGSIYASSNERESGGYKTRKADFEAGRFTDEIEGLPENAKLINGDDGLTYAYNDTAFYKYDREEKASELLFYWINADISDMYNADIKVSKDGEITFLNQSWDFDSEVFEKVSIKKVKITDENRIKTISLAARYLDWDLKDAIIKYNKTNGNYRVEVFDYAEAYDDYDRQTEQISLDVASGKYDIFYGSEPFDSYADAGAFLDITPYVEKSFSKGELFDTVLDTWKKDGKLYYFSSTFGIRALAGNKNIIGNKEKLTIDDIIELRKKNPDIEFLSYGTMDNAFYTALTATIDNFVDSKTGECNFETDDFVKICEFAKTFPKDIGNDYSGDWGGIKDGSIIIVPQYLSSIDNVEIYNQLFDGNMGLYGYPSKEGTGFYIISNNNIAISAKSENQDEAWSFIEEVIIRGKKNYYNGFPILKSAYDDMMEEAMKIETYVDENGVTQKSAKGSWGSEDMTIDYYGASKEVVDRLNEIIPKVSADTEIDEQIYTIIVEEMEPFFSGQKSVEDVAKIIQSRVKLYLAETR